MICSDTLPSAGCAHDNQADQSAGCAETPVADSSAPVLPHDPTIGTGVPNGEAASSDIAPVPPSTLRELEAALRGLGFSRKQAASIAQHGFKTSQADATQDDSKQLSAALSKLQAALKN